MKKFAKMSDLVFPGSKWVHDKNTQTVFNSDTGALYFCTKQTVPIDTDIRDINAAARNGISPFSGRKCPLPTISDKDEPHLDGLFESKTPPGLAVSVTLPGESRKVLLRDAREISIFLEELKRLQMTVSELEVPKPIQPVLERVASDPAFLEEAKS